MSLNIKNEETVRLIRELAGELDVSLTAAVTEAVRSRLDQVRAERDSVEAYVEKVMAIAAAMHERLGDSKLAPGIDDLYDEMGLPR